VVVTTGQLPSSQQPDCCCCRDSHADTAYETETTNWQITVRLTGSESPHTAPRTTERLSILIGNVTLSLTNIFATLIRHSHEKKTSAHTDNSALTDSISDSARHAYSVSQKNIPDVFSYNLRKHCWIFIIFGRNITKKASNQKMLYFSTSPD